MDSAPVLRQGEIEVKGRMPWSSNATFLVTVVGRRPRGQAIYKPVRGERPLWDFPTGLHRREVAAFLLSEASAGDLVPQTVIRDGPLGEGSLQRFVAADFEQHYFTLYEDRADHHDVLRRICAFDLLANNTDRKSGHCLLGADGHIWGIDHGLCFPADPKLRTVIWEFGGERVPTTSCRTWGGSPSACRWRSPTLLDDEEVAALQRRAAALVDRGVFPIDTSGHRYPWPLV